MDRSRLRPQAILLLLTAAAALCGCAEQHKLAEQQLNQLVTLLPGSYDNIAQARADGEGTAQPGGTREALRLVIVPVYAPIIGDHVFYVQEMAAQDQRRVTAQRLMAFDLSPDDVLVQLSIALNEPARWRDGHLNPELFKGLLPNDVKTLTGCDLVWTKTDKGFAGRNDMKQCRATSRATGETLRAEAQAELDADGLAILDRQYDATGRVVIGLQADPWYRFTRRAD